MWRSQVRAGACLSAAALTAMLILAAAFPSAGEEPVYVEGEEYVSYGWNNIGGYDIRVESCSGASQGLAAGGLDVAGEWIKLKVVFTRGGCYDVHVLYQAEYDDTVAFDVKVFDPSAPGGVVAASLTGQGWGFG